MGSMRFGTIAAMAAVTLAVTSTASDAKNFRLFGASKSVHRAPPAQRVLTPQPPPYHWTQGAAPQAHRDMVAEFGKVGLKPGEYVWAASVPATGDTRIIVDLLTQMTYVYRGDQLLGASTISSAKIGHVTPYGFWSILEKRPFYRSKKYDNAPMPFMQRIDNYGIAFHGGNNPGYPASHGCIRLPMKFAEKLFDATKVGSKVVIEG
jgi:lipoprotein-anchoring transpeptidase ErfK/SrfK